VELNSILWLLTILSIICSLTFFINRKQKKQLHKIANKQEPRFDLLTGYSPLPECNPEPEIDSSVYEEPSNNLLLDDPLLSAKEATPIKNKEPENQKKIKSSMGEIIYLILYAKNNKPYMGYELLQALLATGLRFGPMDIFHRYETIEGQGKIFFSLAAANESGKFDISNMGAFSCKGLVMFLRLSNKKDLISAFHLMLETAKQLIEYLDGEILDEERKVLTSEKIKDIQKKLLEFEQKQLMGDLFDPEKP
jgi:cell division protein ZipA